jgi:NADH-quinone oxidoreductase subunit C
MTDPVKDQATLRDKVRERFPELSVEPGIDFPVLTLPASALIETMTALRDDLGFNMLTDITGVDWLPSQPRYHVNYHLLAIPGGERLRVKVQLDDADPPRVPSVVSVWPSANWPEREVYDFFGIDFTGHPNMTRILMPDEWVGYPLRKDYPVGGVPVEYRMEPAYIGENVVPAQARPAAGGVPARLRRDRGRQSHMTWTGPPASGVRKTEPIEGHGPSEEGKED